MRLTLEDRRLAAALLATAAAALIGLASTGAEEQGEASGHGVQRGMQALNNSGEVGTVTVFGHGPQTRIVIRLHGQRAGEREPAMVMRVAVCTAGAHGATIPLAPVGDGVSRTVIDLSSDRLLSGNYSVLVHAADARPGHLVACGHLYR